MEIKQYLSQVLPEAHYSNGKEAHCLVFKICNMFDIDRNSFILEKEKKEMENKTQAKIAEKSANVLIKEPSADTSE